MPLECVKFLYSAQWGSISVTSMYSWQPVMTDVANVPFVQCGHTQFGIQITSSKGEKKGIAIYLQSSNVPLLIRESTSYCASFS